MLRSCRRRPPAASLFGAAALTLAVPSSARAMGGPWFDEGVFLPVGVSLGLSMHPEGVSNGFHFGGEASVAYLSMTSGWWAGAYADVLRDFGAEATRFSLGPEVGWGPFGIDGGYLGYARGGEYKHGFVVRGLLSLAAVHAYGRIGQVFGYAPEQGFGELGVMLKVPIPLWMDGGHERRPEPPPSRPHRAPGYALPPGHVAVPAGPPPPPPEGSRAAPPTNEPLEEQPEREPPR